MFLLTFTFYLPLLVHWFLLVKKSLQIVDAFLAKCHVTADLITRFPSCALISYHFFSAFLLRLVLLSIHSSRSDVPRTCWTPLEMLFQQKIVFTRCWFSSSLSRPLLMHMCVVFFAPQRLSLSFLFTFLPSWRLSLLLSADFLFYLLLFFNSLL
jgi:hypothetical protein